MAQVTILGAGDMGTALATPLAANGHRVHLWGTHLDHEIIAALGAGDPHPRLGSHLPPGTTVFGADRASEAIAGSDLVVVAVTSSAVGSVIGTLAADLADVPALVTVAKGFDRDPDGAILLLPGVIRLTYRGPVVAVGGPSKANEVAVGSPTAVVFAGDQPGSVADCAAAFTTPTYRVEISDDPVGVEVAAAMKNAYAIALGIADGLERATGRPHHNLKAALFPLAVREMGLLATYLGGRHDTVAGLAGAGDLQVTITSGRNRLLGEKIGAGEPARAAAERLAGGGTTIEGHAAVSFGHEIATRAIAAGALPIGSLPLLDALAEILTTDSPALPTLWAAIAGS